MPPETMTPPIEEAGVEIDPRIASAQTLEEFFGVLDAMDKKEARKTAEGILAIVRGDGSTTAESLETMAKRWGVTSKSGIRGKFIELVQKELGF